MANKLGVLVASRLPPPGKLPKPSEPDADDKGGAPDADGDDQQAAELDAMREFENAETTEEKVAALKNFIDICKPGY